MRIIAAPARQSTSSKPAAINMAVLRLDAANVSATRAVVLTVQRIPDTGTVTWIAVEDVAVESRPASAAVRSGVTGAAVNRPEMPPGLVRMTPAWSVTWT